MLREADVVVNVLPMWLPIVNLVISVGAFVFALVALLWSRDKSLPAERITWSLFWSVAVMVGGALFQSNTIDLVAWTLVGTLGRLATLVAIGAAVYQTWRERKARGSSRRVVRIKDDPRHTT
jgi:hypothetical protein